MLKAIVTLCSGFEPEYSLVAEAAAVNSRPVATANRSTDYAVLVKEIDLGLGHLIT